MAFITFKDRSCKIVPPALGAKYWLIKNGEEQGSAKDRKFVENIEHIYLNPRNAPASYQVKRFLEESEPVTHYERLPYID